MSFCVLGNGAAMRVHPIGLFSHNASNTSIVENVKKSAKVTHTHMDAINGAVLQAACVSWALQGKRLIKLSLIDTRTGVAGNYLHAKIYKAF